MKSLISIVIPYYNEQGNVFPMIRSIEKQCSAFSYEIIAVDDGSTDLTPQELLEIKNRSAHIKTVTLKKNFGQTAALAAGIDNSEGSVVITMDGDQQNDPSDIPLLLNKIEEGYDVVSGWRKNRQDKFLTRRLPSILANKLIATFTGVNIHDFGCTLKAYRRSTLKDLQLYGEMHRFIPAWCAWQGGKVTEIVVQHHPRLIGQSKYGLFRIFKVLIDLMTLKFFSSYLSKPNYLFSGTGLVCGILSIFTAFFAFYDKWGPNLIPEFRIPLLLLSMALGLTSIFMILMGLLAELLVKIYFQNSDQKPYRIRNEETL